MADIILKDRDGNDVECLGAESVQLKTVDGGTVLFYEEGAGSSDDVSAGNGASKAINFYDQFGNILYSYTRAEAQNLTELPEGPGIDGFEFDGWTHTLDEVKNTEFFLDVGPVYAKDGVPVTIVILKIPCESLDVRLHFKFTGTSNSLAIHWGDGESTTVAGLASTSTAAIVATHTYSEPGTKYAYLVPQNEGVNYGLGYYRSTSYIYPFACETSITLMRSTRGYLASHKLVSLLINEDGTGTSFSLNALMLNCNLQFVAYRENAGISSGMNIAYVFSDCINLHHIATNAVINLGATAKPYLYTGLKRMKVNDARYLTNFEGSLQMDDLLITTNYSGIILQDVNLTHRLILNKNSFLELSVDTPTFGTKDVYVPDDLVETYKTADGWSDIAEYIKPASEYPDY